ncbi:MAG: YraN family protein [Bifidobacteriaceae bacterium]|jgi:putative endonuclease|nr:YraN family protein [Bifidobacteriaceae bacterium]
MTSTPRRTVDAKPAAGSGWAGGSRRALGRYGEAVAAAFLTLKGWKLLDRNWRTREGELDLVAQADPRTLVFVEVKTRRSVVCGVPAAAVTAEKLARLRRLAAAWLVSHDHHAEVVRIDVIAVTTGTAAGRAIEHIEGVMP